MKIKCSCNNLIVDQTDYLKNKGYIISDTQWGDFWDLIDNEIENPKTTKIERENSCMKVRELNVFKGIWECSNCGNLYIDGNKKGELLIYLPESREYNRALDKKKVNLL